MKPLWAFVALVALPAAAPAAPAGRVSQPVHEYFTPFAACPDGDGRDFNSRYTHIGTDFGRMGPGEAHLVWQPGAARVDLSAGGWAGMWHSLAGLARERAAALDFLPLYPPFLLAPFPPRCR